MYGLKVYITPEDVLDKLSDEDKERFNQCVFTNVVREADGSVTIECVVFNDPDPYVRQKELKRRQSAQNKVWMVDEYDRKA